MIFSLVKITLFCPRDSVNQTLFIFQTGTTVTPSYGNPVIYNKPLFLPRVMTRFPLMTFHCCFPNFTSCPCSSNCLTEIKLFVKLKTTLTSFKVQKPTGVFNTMSLIPITSRVLLSASSAPPPSLVTAVALHFVPSQTNTPIEHTHNPSFGTPLQPQFLCLVN